MSLLCTENQRKVVSLDRRQKEPRSGCSGKSSENENDGPAEADKETKTVTEETVKESEES